MSIQLLDKTRKINKLLHNNSHSKVVFSDVCVVLTDILDANVLIVSRKGKVLGISTSRIVPELPEFISLKNGQFIDRTLNERWLSILSTKENVNLMTLGFNSDEVLRYEALITPIDISGERLGTLFVYKKNERFDISDIILCEYGATVVSLEMMRAEREEAESKKRQIQVVKAALNSLSFSELEAIMSIFDELGGPEGVLIASKVADSVGITRSVIVNALRKFESAGVIESRSSGMRGTYIKVVNDYIFEELNEIKESRKIPAKSEE